MAAGGNGDNSENKAPAKIEITPGCQVWCKTLFNEEFRGTVMGYDHDYRVIFIKSSSTESGNNKKSFDVSMVNLNHVSYSNFKLVALSEADPPKLPEYDLDKINKRYESAVGEKMRAASKVGVNVTNEAQDLFNSINKYYPDCKWDGEHIIVLEDAKISPPYQPENCSGHMSLDHIRKMVEKFHNDRQQESKTKQ